MFFQHKFLYVIIFILRKKRTKHTTNNKTHELNILPVESGVERKILYALYALAVLIQSLLLLRIS